MFTDTQHPAAESQLWQQPCRNTGTAIPEALWGVLQRKLSTAASLVENPQTGEKTARSTELGCKLQPH